MSNKNQKRIRKEYRAVLRDYASEDIKEYVRRLKKKNVFFKILTIVLGIIYIGAICLLALGLVKISF